MKKLNVNISNTIIKKCCIHYKNIQTGLTIYLFNIDNIVSKKDEITTFNIDAFSFCPINNKLTFKIFFNYSIANCLFNSPFSIIKKKKKKNNNI